MCGTCGWAQPVQQAPHQRALGQAVLHRNDATAARWRQRFNAAGLPVINLLSSPGSGKTALLEALARHWSRPDRVGVIVGDLATDNDACRLQAAGLQAVQITTGQLCHLEMDQLEPVLQQFDLEALDLLVIENVGNLVCPAAFDLGETCRVVLIAITEGDVKPLKYAPLFVSADLVLINKLDLAEAIGWEPQPMHRHLARVAPAATVLEVSARSGVGLAQLHRALHRQQRRVGRRDGG